MLLLIMVGGSSWLLHWSNEDQLGRKPAGTRSPDYYMENFSTLTMKSDGTPKHRLYADHMAHYPDNDTTALRRPRLEIFGENRPPMRIAAARGQAVDDNKVILLTGDVNFKTYKQTGELEFEVITTEARVLVDQEYVETDKEATLIGRRLIINAIGMKAYLQENRLEFINHVRTAITPNATH